MAKLTIHIPHYAMKKQIIIVSGFIIAALLLVLFINTSTTANLDAAQPETVVIKIIDDGKLSGHITVDGLQCPPEQVAARLADLGVKKGTTAELHIYPLAPHRLSKAIYDAIFASGVDRFAIME